MPSKARDGASAVNLFQPVSVGRASENVVRQIKAAIHEGKLGPGDGLPSERELTERLGVSRVTVRDALRTLEATGLVEIRVGARGGAFITAPGPGHVGEGLAHMLLLSSTAPEDVTEARMIFELGAIRLVCERRTEEDLIELEEICARAKAALDSGEFDVRISADFHTRLAKCTHNIAIELIVHSFQGPLLRSLARAKDVAPHMGKQGAKEHRELVESIRIRDADGAYAVMARHLGRTAARLHGSETGPLEDAAGG